MDYRLEKYGNCFPKRFVEIKSGYAKKRYPLVGMVLNYEREYYGGNGTAKTAFVRVRIEEVDCFKDTNRMVYEVLCFGNDVNDKVYWAQDQFKVGKYYCFWVTLKSNVWKDKLTGVDRYSTSLIYTGHEDLTDEEREVIEAERRKYQQEKRADAVRDYNNKMKAEQLHNKNWSREQSNLPEPNDPPF